MGAKECIEAGKAYLGIEFGSTRIKGVVADENGTVLTVYYPIRGAVTGVVRIHFHDGRMGNPGTELRIDVRNFRAEDNFFDILTSNNITCQLPASHIHRAGESQDIVFQRPDTAADLTGVVFAFNMNGQIGLIVRPAGGHYEDGQYVFTGFRRGADGKYIFSVE